MLYDLIHRFAVSVTTTLHSLFCSHPNNNDWENEKVGSFALLNQLLLVTAIANDKTIENLLH